MTFVKQYTSLGELGAIISNFNLEAALGATIANITSAVADISAVADTVNAVQDAYDQVQGAVDQVQDAYNQVQDTVNQVQNAYDQVKGVYDDAMQTYDDAKGLVGDVQNAATGLVDEAKGKVGEVKNMGKNAINQAKSGVKGAINKATKSITSTISLPGELQGLGFENAVKNPKQMANLVAKELLPPIDAVVSNLTDEEKLERQKKRLALRDAALADVYGFAVSEEATDQNEQLTQMQKKVDKSETLQEKAGAALALGLSRTGQLVRSNAILAAQLRLLAADAIANLPVDYVF